MKSSSDTSADGHQFSEDGIRRINRHYPQEVIGQKKAAWQEFIRNLKPYPANFNARGIVICAGGAAYFTCAWINIKLLRKRGCALPVELWHQEGELDNESITELAKLKVVCKNFADHSNEKIGNGYRMKPLAILYSSFKEILFLDADNNCLKDPSFLFDSPLYKKTGAVFWPDYWSTERSNPIWQIINSEVKDIREQESGQILINKEKCWKEINLCLFFNIDPFYYEILWGDKDTFRFSWMALKTPYHMIRQNLAPLGFQQKELGFSSVAMLQHDFTGEPLFVHSNLLKWHERTSDQPFWKEIRKIPQEEKSAITMEYHPDFEKYFLNIEGKSMLITEKDSIAKLENDCLKELEHLRTADFYTRFLQELR